VNSLKDAAARVKALRDEVINIEDTAVKEQRDLSVKEADRIGEIRQEMVLLKVRIDEMKAERAQRKELDKIAEGVDDVQDFSTKGSVPRGPAVGWDVEQMKSLHTAALERRPMSFGAKLVTTTEAPQATRVTYRLTDFPYMRDAMRVLDYLPVEETPTPQVTYYRALNAASAAAPVAEGVAKAESTPSFESVTVVCRKIAHYLKATTEAISDFPNFMDVVGRELMAGLIDAENAQLLSGTGTPPALQGLLTTSGVDVQPRGTDSNADAIFKAIQEVRINTFSDPTLLVMRPDNFTALRLSKASGSGEYLAGAIMDSEPRRMWGFNYVLTTRLPANEALVMNANLGAKVYVREYPRLSTGLEGADFKENKVTLVAEERLALTVPRPPAVVRVTGLTT
jgi:HK97 family phage major capsid protein